MLIQKWLIQKGVYIKYRLRRRRGSVPVRSGSGVSFAFCTLAGGKASDVVFLWTEGSPETPALVCATSGLWECWPETWILSAISCPSGWRQSVVCTARKSCPSSGLEDSQSEGLSQHSKPLMIAMILFCVWTLTEQWAKLGNTKLLEDYW